MIRSYSDCIQFQVRSAMNSFLIRQLFCGDPPVGIDVSYWPPQVISHISNPGLGLSSTRNRFK